MELKEFVSESLLQIFNGVRQAQEQTKETGGAVVAQVVGTKKEHPSVLGYTHNNAIVLVDFDVSLNTIDVTKEKAGLGLFVAAFGGGAQFGSEASNSQLSRLRFSVPVMLPPPNLPATEQ